MAVEGQKYEVHYLPEDPWNKSIVHLDRPRN